MVDWEAVWEKYIVGEDDQTTCAVFSNVLRATPVLILKFFVFFTVFAVHMWVSCPFNPVGSYLVMATASLVWWVCSHKYNYNFYLHWDIYISYTCNGNSVLNRTTSAPMSVLCYDVYNWCWNFELEFCTYRHLQPSYRFAEQQYADIV